MATLEEQNEIASYALQFRNKVNSLIDDEEERSKLFDALRNYLESRKVKKLVRDLKLVLDNSKKYPLFKEIRAFIPPEHIFAFDKLTEGARTGERIVHLKRHGNEPLGFKFKGGFEHGIGIYVSAIIPGSAAHVSGLRIGDEILKVNGFVLHESIHDEVVNVLKNKKSLTFVTKNMGKIPNKVNNRIVWQEVDPNMQIATSDLWDPKFRLLPSSDSQSAESERSDDRLLAFKVGKDGLGCSILSGIESFEGVFVSAISQKMLADQVGLQVGDQILQVNGRIFDKIKHSEAVEALKARKELTMIVRHNEDVAEYLRRKAKQKSDVLQPILVKEGENREISKRATFGEELLIEYIERDDDEEFDDDHDEGGTVESHEPAEGNFEYDESITQGREVHFVSILKTAPLMLDLEVKNNMVLVRNALKGGAASEHGFLKRGDVLLNVEGTDLLDLSPTEAQEAITDAMGRLSQYIDMVVACPPGRKPPILQDISDLSPRKDHQSQQSGDGPDGQPDKVNDMKSAVARAIAQFESKSSKSTAFLLRRDSLEKARNSVRLYKEKSRPALSKNLAQGLSPSKMSLTPPANRRNDETPKRIGMSGLSSSLDSIVSPAMPRKSAFSMIDPKPVTFTTGARTPNRNSNFDAVVSEPKQRWAAALTRVASNDLSQTSPKSLSDEGPSQPASTQQTPLRAQQNEQGPWQSTTYSGQTDVSPQGKSPKSNNTSPSQTLAFSSKPEQSPQANATQSNQLIPSQPSTFTGQKIQSSQRNGTQSNYTSPSQQVTFSSQPIRSPPGKGSNENHTPLTQPSKFSSQSTQSPHSNGQKLNDHARKGTQDAKFDGGYQSFQVATEASSRRGDEPRAKEYVPNMKFAGTSNFSSPEQKRFDPIAGEASKEDSLQLSETKYKVRAQVHSPPTISNDEILKTWAPTSPIRGHSTENLSSRRSVAFDKEVTEIFQDNSVLSPKSRSLSLDELNDRVDKKYDGGVREKDPRQARKKSVGFKETVESIEPLENPPFRSLDDISMIGKSGWDERIAKYDKQETHLLQPKKSALRNSPSPRPVGKNEYIESLYEGDIASDINDQQHHPRVLDDKDGTTAAASSRKHRKLLPSSSLDDDPGFNEEIDQLARSVDPSIVIPVPDYDDASVNTSSMSNSFQSPPKPTGPAETEVKPKKRNTSLGLTNRLLSNAKDKLKRVGFRRASQEASAKGGHESGEKQRKPSKTLPPVSHAPASPSPPPPPPPPLPALQPAVPMSPQRPAAPQLPPALIKHTPASVSHDPPAEMSLAQQILNSPVRKAAAKRNYDDLTGNSRSQSRSDDEADYDGLVVSQAIASEMAEDVKIASVIAGKDSAPRPKPSKPTQLVDMSEVLSELKGKVKGSEKRARPFSVHAENPSAHATSYTKSHEKRMQSEPNPTEPPVFGFGRISSESSPSKTNVQSRDTRISRRQAQSVAEVDSDLLEQGPSGLASAVVTPRSARLEKNAILEMEGTLKEFDEVIRSLDTEL